MLGTFPVLQLSSIKLLWPTDSLGKAVTVILLLAALAFGKKLWSELELLATQRMASGVGRIFQRWTSRYDHKYRQYLVNRYWALRHETLQARVPFPFSLEQVYVEHCMVDSAPASVAADMVSRSQTFSSMALRDMITRLETRKGPGEAFAIIGPPGSGKSTLLRHLCLMFAEPTHSSRTMPFLLSLAEHAPFIATNPGMTLVELIRATLLGHPPPEGWLEAKFKKGNCLAMFDGLDEVDDLRMRRKVVAWLEDQRAIYGFCPFVVTSRPNGFLQNPLTGFLVFRLLLFNPRQIEQFVRNWYLAFETQHPGRMDLRPAGQHSAEDLLQLLRSNSSLRELAANPFLLSLIATLHQAGYELPENRVAVLADICAQALRGRPEAHPAELDAGQQARILELLACRMVFAGKVEISADEAAGIVTALLKEMAPGIDGSKFLRDVSQSSGLLSEPEAGVYAFAHSLFRDYMASVYISSHGLVNELCSHIDQSTWHETMRLYAAQADATPIVEQCLLNEKPNLEILLLATDCEAEARTVSTDAREHLRRVLEVALEHQDPAWRTLAAEHKLAKRLRTMIALDYEAGVDRCPISHAEYQLFINDLLQKGESHVPDHWNSSSFPSGTGDAPVTGMLLRDAHAFCLWLTKRTNDGWSYRLPQQMELSGLGDLPNSWARLFFFTTDGQTGLPVLTGETILHQIARDASYASEDQELSFSITRLHRRLIWFALWRTLSQKKRPDQDVLLALSFAFDRALEHKLNRDLDNASAAELDRQLRMGNRVAVEEDLTAIRLKPETLELLSPFPNARPWDLALRINDDQDRAIAKAIARDLNNPVLLSRAAHILNWLCILELRSSGESEAVEALWIARTRQARR